MSLSTTKISEKQVRDTLVPVTYIADATETAGRYYITSSLQWTINNVVNGNEIRFVIKPETGIKIVGILGTPGIKQLGMIIDLSRGIVTIKSEPNNLADK